MQPTVVVPAGDHCGEGATWCPETQTLYWTDINRFLLHEYRPATGATRSWMFDQPVVALGLTNVPGRLLVALASMVMVWDVATASRQAILFRLPGFPRVRLNDGRVSPHGNFWVGSMRNNVGPDGEVMAAGGTDGVLYRITPDGGISVWRDGIGISNTLCWSPDGRKFLFADSLANRIDRFAYDGDIGDAEVFHAGHPRGAPDGSAIDVDGVLYNCRYGGGCLLALSPNGAVREIEMPVAAPTTACFGGDDLRTLFITSASLGGKGYERLGGSLFAIRMERPGLPENRFQLQ